MRGRRTNFRPSAKLYEARGGAGFVGTIETYASGYKCGKIFVAVTEIYETE